MPQIIKSSKGFLPRGNSLKAYKSKAEEVILGGEVNSGKTYVNLNKAHNFCIKYKNARILIVMKTMRQLMRTAVETFLYEVLPYPPGHPKCPVWQKEDPDFGTYFQYKHNNAKIFLGGLRDRSATLGTEYDAIIVVQAEQILEDDWQILLTRIGRGVGKNAPFHFIQGCANPHPLGEQHWIRKRKYIVYFKSSRKDHPGLWDDKTQTWTEEGQIVEDRYQKLTGALGLRMREGIWAQNANLVINTFQRDIHVIPKEEFESRNIQWEKFYMAVDWGYKDPGSLSLYGLEFGDILWQVRTTYRTYEHVPTYWIPRALEYQDWVLSEYDKPIEMIYCDPSQPSYIDQFKDNKLPAVGAKVKPKMFNLNALRQRFDEDKMFIVGENIDDIDEALEMNNDPTCLADELVVFSHRLPKEKDIKSVTDNLLEDGNDHSVDESSYICGALFTPIVKPKVKSRVFTQEQLNRDLGYEFII